MAAETSPRNVRLHIGLFGRRNVGKSSVLNALVRQSVSIVSPMPGTTTDPIEKAMELQPAGPVVFIDTAGLDDGGGLGSLRVDRARQAIERADLAVLVADAGAWGELEESFIADAEGRGLPLVIAVNKADARAASAELRRKLDGKRHAWVETSALTGLGIAELRQALVSNAQPLLDEPPPLVADLVAGGDLAVLVVPIDKEAPKGRLILPQVQAIREVLDQDALCMVVKERELRSALDRLSTPPKIVITDSQAFLKVAADTPSGTLQFEHVQGRDFPDDLSGFDLVVHCGACMWNRQSMRARIRRCQAAGVPITNYGLMIAYSLGILERALAPFPAALEFYRSRKREEPGR